MDEVGIGLDGAENMGQDGERGEVGLGFGGLQDRTTRKLISTHRETTMGAWEVHGRPSDGALEQNTGTLKPRDMWSRPSHTSPDQTFSSSKEFLFCNSSKHKHVSLPSRTNCFLGDRHVSMFMVPLAPGGQCLTHIPVFHILSPALSTQAGLTPASAPTLT